MYSVSDEFLEAVQSNTRTYDWTGTITTTGGSVYTFGYEDIVKGSGCITRQCCGSSEIELGTVYAAELTLSLFSNIDRYTLDSAIIELYFRLTLADGSVETVPMGVFEISEANRNIRTLELTAYDYMLRFDETLDLDIESGTAYDFLSIACETCGVEMAQSEEEIETLPNGTETMEVYTSDDLETWRDLLYYVAQALGCVCQIDREGKLELLQYGTQAVLEVPAEQRFDSSYSDFVTQYTAIYLTNLRTEQAEYYALADDNGLTMSLGSNPLLQYEDMDDRERIAASILSALSQVSYVPFDSQTIGNPALDPMDILCFSGGHADATQISCITSISYNIGGKMRLKCVGKNPKLAGAKSKTDKNISGLLNQVTTLTQTVASLLNDDSSAIEFGELTGNGTLYFTTAYEGRPFFYLHTNADTGIVEDGSDGTVELAMYGNYYIGLSLTGVDENTTTLIVCYCTLPAEVDEDTISHEHTYSATFTWAEDYSSCTATFVCSDCGNTQTISCTVTSQTTAATEDEDGETVYTATCTLSGTAYTDSQSVTIPATGDGWTLTHQWDLASSAVDSVTDGETTLTGCVITEDGLYFSAAAQNCYLGSIWGTNHAIEIDCGEMTPHSDTSVHLRTFMLYASGLNKTEGLVWRWQTGAWAFYHDGAWESDLGFSDRDYFSGKTVRFESDSEGYLSLYVDGELVGESASAFASQTEFSLGSYGNSFYEAYFKAVRVYEKGGS